MNNIFSRDEVEGAVVKLGAIVEGVRSGSALVGLSIIAVAFAALLDVYAMPNAENPQGMCDDKQAFRKHFANLLIATPELRKKKAKKAGKR